MRYFVFILILFLVPLLSINTSHSEVFSFNKDSSVIGFSRIYNIQGTESLMEIARKFNLGYNEIAASNPDIDPFLPDADTPVIIPTSWILPDVASYNGIVINLSEMRLYYFFQQKGINLVRTFPIGIGREGYDTPLGQFRIIQKQENPSWHPPESVRAEKPELPKIVPPGPDNPLGTHSLRLSLNTYLIHGTNKPWGVGRRVSHGCIRLYPEDIPILFNLVKIGDKVEIVKQPIKIGVKDNKVFIEVHEDDFDNYFGEAFLLLTKKNLLERVHTGKLYYALRKKSGEPFDITY